MVSTDCLTDVVCASSDKDCSMGQRCNTALSTPRCQAIYCGANGSVCGDDVGDAQNLCASKACVGGECAASDGFGCDVRGSFHLCYDESGATATAMSACTGSMKGTIVSSCDRTGSIGGCKVTSNGSTTTSWAYPPATSDQYRSSCTGGGGVFVTP